LKSANRRYLPEENRHGERHVQGLSASKGFTAPHLQEIIEKRLQAWCQDNRFAESSWQANDAATRMVSILRGCGHEEAAFRELMATFK